MTAAGFRVRDAQRFTDLSYAGEVLATAPNEHIAIRYNPERSPLYTAQFLSDADLHEFDLGAGTLVVARRNLGAGLTEFLEVSAAGDTLWRRRQALEAVAATRAVLDEQIDRYVRLAAAFPGSSLPRAAIRRSVEGLAGRPLCRWKEARARRLTRLPASSRIRPWT